ncbi:MAG: dihydropteroate synthase [Clostridia bacterium]|jgi:dihydropteroate synthase|nr:dihydropteroate synthase [Clostridia bacterium]
MELANRTEAETALRSIGVEEAGVAIMAPKAVHRVIKVENIPLRAAHILKQEMLSLGGEAAVSREVMALTADKSEVILMGTLRQFERLTEKLRHQYFGLPSLAEQLSALLRHAEGRPVRLLDCRGRRLVVGERTLVMGILNVTPDSFSDGGLYLDPGKALARAQEMVAEGADLIDVGGVSTRPGHTPVPAEEEWRRLAPVLGRLAETVEAPISVDTWRAEVARRALETGAHLINDQWGLQADPDLARVAARYGAPVILMHNQEHREYRDLMGDILRFLRRGIEIAERSGLTRDRLIADPGIGFGKDTEQNLEVLHRLPELRSLGLPILIGTSRKSVIGNTLGLPVEERLEGTAATVALGIAFGADIIRVHDVKAMVRVARMTDAVVRR